MPFHITELSASESVAIFRALGSEPRARIVELLADRPMNINELSLALGLAQPSVSKHVQILEEAGLVVSEYLAGPQGMQKRCRRVHERIMVEMEGARRHLLALSGRSHQLNSGAGLVRDGNVLWRHVGIASMTMRKLEPAFIGRHLARVGAKALSSVGAYQIEGEGIQLFDRIEGDHFTIVGLPLLPLLAELRNLGALDG